ncbi:MAG: hypothetical protein ACI9Y1_000732 [Lentisphaeria bacterium]
MIYAENGLLENIQVLTLTVASIGFIVPTFHNERSDKLITLFFAFLCFSFVLRELDVEKLNVPDILIFFGSGTGRNVMLASGFLAIALYAARNVAYYKTLALDLVFSERGIMLSLAACLLYSGQYFEDLETLQHHVLFEELCELSAYAAILIVAHSYKNRTRNKVRLTL